MTAARKVLHIPPDSRQFSVTINGKAVTRDVADMAILAMPPHT